MKNLPINFEELSFVLHRGADMKMECYLDLRNGAILNIPTNEKLISSMYSKTINPININHNFFVDQIIAGKDYYLYIPDHFQNQLFNLMSSFANSLSGKGFPETDDLWRTINEEGGYSEFHLILTKNDDLYDLFISFRDSIYEKSAREWLSENKINPIQRHASGTVY